MTNNFQKSKPIAGHLQDGTITVNDVIIFTESKAPTWKNPRHKYNLPFNLGLECSQKTCIVAIDVDHLHEHKEAETSFNTIRDKYFLDATPSFNIHEYKYKLIFKITDNQEALKKYEITDGIDVVGYEDKAIEFFGASFKKQCIKLQGEYWKEENKVTDDEKNLIEDTKIKDSKKLCKLGCYTTDFSIIEITSDVLCKFIDEILATNLFTIRKESKQKPKTEDELKEVYAKIPESIKIHLDSIARADGEKSNQEYLDNCYPYIQECIKQDYTFQDCRYFMEQTLIERGIKSSKYNNFVKIAEEEYSKAKYFTKKNFNHSVLAEELIKDYKIRKYNNNIYYWYDNLYHSNHETFLTGIVQDKLPQLKKNQKQEVIYHINHANSVKEIKHADLNYIQFKNGILNLDTGELSAPNSDIFITNIIPHNYNPNAYDEIVEKSLKQWACDDDSIYNLLLECAGYTLYRNCKFKKGFILYGEKNNGKSSYIDLLINMLGKENITSHDLKDLTNQFYRVTLKDKLANIGDDIQKSYTDSSDFKKIVSGDMISAKASHKDPIDFKPYCKLIFSCNDLPKLTDNTGAVHNRLILIPFNADFSNNPNKDLRTHLASDGAIESFIVLAVKGLLNLLKNDKFTESDAVEREREQFRVNNNSILSFIQELTETDIDSSIPVYKRESIDTLFNKYKNYCDDNKYKPFGLSIFSRKICSELKLKVQRRMVLRHKESFFIDK